MLLLSKSNFSILFMAAPTFKVGALLCEYPGFYNKMPPSFSILLSLALANGLQPCVILRALAQILLD